MTTKQGSLTVSVQSQSQQDSLTGKFIKKSDSLLHVCETVSGLNEKSANCVQPTGNSVSEQCHMRLYVACLDLKVHTAHTSEEFPLRAALRSFQEVLVQRKFCFRGK